MMIQNISNQSILKPQMKNSSFEKIVSLINANSDKKSNFDTVELSEKARALLKENNEIKEKEPTLNDNDSKMVSSIRWGKHTKAEFAKMSLSEQRDNLKTMSDEIDYRKSKLKLTMEKISELENFLNGTGTHSDPYMIESDAEDYLYNYKQSIVDDYADFTIRSSYFADEFDKLSGGLASEIFKNPLDSLNALGLDNLSSDPKEIMEALDNASKILDKMTADLESAFANANGGKGFTEPARSHSAFDGESPLNFFVSQMEKIFSAQELSVSNSNLSGETLAAGDGNMLQIAHYVDRSKGRLHHKANKNG